MNSATFAAPALAVSLTGAACAQPTFTPLGLPPQAFDAIGLSISDDGATVAGALDTFNRDQSSGAWVWRAGHGFTYLAHAATDYDAGAFAVSGNGARIVGVTDDPYMGTCGAASWTPTGAFTPLGDLPGGDDRAMANGVSRTGAYVVGTGATELAGSEAFIIGPDGVMRSLGFLNGQDWSEAFAVTPDGAVAVGMAYTTLLNFDAAYFSSGFIQDLGRLPGSFGAYAYAVADDGLTAAGESYIWDEVADNIYSHGFVWTQEIGMTELGPRPAPFVGSAAFCMNAAGTLIGGTLIDANNWTYAMLWDQQRGCRLLSDVLTDAGLGTRIQGWALDNVAGISADGTFILGNGYSPSGSYTPFIVHLPAPACSADFDCDGDTGTDADIESFFACVAGNCPLAPCLNTADFNGDGDVGTDADIEAFFRVLSGGSC